MCIGFKVQWTATCHVCQNPLDVRLYPKHSYDEFLSYILKFKIMYPFVLINNTSIYKFFGLKVRKVCISCYVREPQRTNLVTLTQREVSGKRIRIRTDSKSPREIYNWCDSFNRFINKPNLNELMTDPVTYIC